MSRRASKEPPRSPWEALESDKELRSLYSITDADMSLLRRVDMLGRIGAPRDFIYILELVRGTLKNK